jgi:hypothetical protein
MKIGFGDAFIALSDIFAQTASIYQFGAERAFVVGIYACTGLACVANGAGLASQAMLNN